MRPVKDIHSASSKHPPIYIISGGVGASGEQIVHTLLAQFPDNQAPVITFGNIRSVEQIGQVLAKAKKKTGLIVHTLIDSDLRKELVQLAEREGVLAIDLMGDLMSWMVTNYGQKPLGVAGLYRQLNKDYFERVSAIEFTMAHDDGKDPSGWPKADIVLVGVSRTGKTPISLYLSVLGWKVANIPLVPEIPTPAGLYELDHRRVIGLTIEPGQLLLHRQHRQRQLGVTGASAYADPAQIHEEIQQSRKFFRQAGISIINVTDKPIETCTDEIIRTIARQSGIGYS
jgi:[pyruvate, water dikinase]-phosphate phosphotransferase / [pyruvate, water dikinase] kinase